MRGGDGMIRSDSEDAMWAALGYDIEVGGVGSGKKKMVIGSGR